MPWCWNYQKKPTQTLVVAERVESDEANYIGLHHDDDGGPYLTIAGDDAADGGAHHAHSALLGAEAIANLLKDRTALTTLRLYGNHTGMVFAKANAEAVRSTNTSITLYLDNGKVAEDEDAWAMIAEAVTMCGTRTLQCLDLYRISNVGAMVMAVKLRTTTTPSTLRVRCLFPCVRLEM
jgi:hypothetical protein